AAPLAVDRAVDARRPDVASHEVHVDAADAAVVREVRLDDGIPVHDALGACARRSSLRFADLVADHGARQGGSRAYPRRYSAFSRIGARGRPREWSRISDVLQLPEPPHDALRAEAEAGVGHASVAAQVEVPLVGR